MAQTYAARESANEPEGVSARIAKALEDARRELIDLSRRNRLLHAPRTGKRPHCLEIRDAHPDDLFQGLVGQTKAYSFLSEDDSDRMLEGSPSSSSRRSLYLWTALTRESLDRRLLKLFREARTFEEEQGVNILFVAFGILKWFDDPRVEEPSLAPLVLVPVTLERKQGRDAFLLRGRDDDLIVNVSLREKLRIVAGIDLPELPDSDSWSPSDYFDSVASAIEAQQRWEVDRSALGLGFFTFSKFLMWRDLDASAWPQASQLLTHPLVGALMGEGQGVRAVAPIADDDEPIDKKIDLASAIHVLNADSSQAVVVEEARRQNNLVVQGPPGTGKSQTIANIIATAVHEGKSVLFVAEKAAALDVVHSRLKAVGLEPLCLEVHSRKATKLAVIASLERALRAVGISASDASNTPALRQVRDRLNEWSEKLHRPIGNTRRTPYRVMGTILKLRAEGTVFDCAVDPERLDIVNNWTEDQLRAAEELVDRAGLACSKLGGPPKDNSWFGTYGKRLTPLDLDRVTAALSATAESIPPVADGDIAIRKDFDLSNESTLADAYGLVQVSRLVADTSDVGRAALANSAWKNERIRISTLLEFGRSWSKLKTVFRKMAAEPVWKTDLSLIRTRLAAQGKSPFRLFSSKYRRAVAGLRAACRSEPPKRLAERLNLLDDLIAAKNSILKFAEEEEFAKAALGPLWAGENTRWDAIAQLMGTAEAIDHIQEGWALALRGLCSQAIGRMNVDQFEHTLDNLRQKLNRIDQYLAPDLLAIANATGWDEIPISKVACLIADWSSHLESYDDWVVARESIAGLNAVGLSSIAGDLTAGVVRFDELRRIFDLLVADSLWKRACQDDAALEEIDGVLRNEFVDDFRARDRRRIIQARTEVLARYIQSRPNGDVGEMGIIRDEIGKKRRHLPIRKLMERAGSAIQRLKPVFLMSPLSAAHFLPPGRITFDLMVIDEASQVPPEDALGVVARARQIIVVGDEKQLPPTNFFKMVTADEDEEEQEDSTSQSRTRDFESILTLARARGVSERMLKWHYRSRHPSLIALSNTECYGGSLLLPPSPLSTEQGLGLSMVRTPPGHYDRGGSGRNLVEANIVAEAVETHLREHAEQSLGVACFSVAQREAIEDALHERGLTSATDAFAPSGERFFVKNLETVQGDERDVVLISVGYGRDSLNRMSSNFGPVSRDGGERRLNVLISRARFRCVVYSSIGAGDIAADTKTRGTRMLREFLHYAETGKIAAGNVTGSDFDSPFEEAVALAIRRAGYRVASQVGVSGFRIDLGVFHPEEQGRFVLGVECDGATYHSSRSARDRDRLRQEVLENLGWKLHRIWSSDWFRNPNRETDRLLTAIKNACAEAPSDKKPKYGPPDTNNAPSLERSDADERIAPLSNVNPASELRQLTPYKECRLAVQRGVDMLQLPPRQLANLSFTVVKNEGPIHTEEVARRIREAFGLERTGTRILEAVTASLRVAEKNGALVGHRDFWSIPGENLGLPRDRRNAALALRRADRIAPTEYEAAISLILKQAVGCPQEELIVETAKLLGFDRTGPELKTAIRQQIEEMHRSGKVEMIDGQIRERTGKPLGVRK
ncbi:MAG: DUF3320 domain-containing protein [Rhizomicrobium sp.]